MCSGGRAKLVVDSGVVLRLAAEDREIPAKHELLAPTLLRSQVRAASRLVDVVGFEALA